MQTLTPLPAARPSAFSTTGMPSREIAARASASVRTVSASAVGTWAACMTSLANALLPSSRAAARVGPNASSPAFANASTTPRQSGTSGPTTVKSGRFSDAHATSPSMFSADTGTFCAISAVPALPGAQKIRAAGSSLWSFHAMACSRPPLPMTRIFM